MAEEKRIQDRKRNLIVLIARYLINMGYFEISSKLQAESNISLDKLYFVVFQGFLGMWQTTSTCT